MKKIFIFLSAVLTSVSLSKSSKVAEPSAAELQLACNRLQASKNLRDEWNLDFKQATEKWMEVKKIEGEFEPLESCQEKSNSLHQGIVRAEGYLTKETTNAAEELESFSIEGQKCKSKEKADRLNLVLGKMKARTEEFKATAIQSSELHKQQGALSENLERVRKLPSEIPPKVDSMNERLENAQRARQTLQKYLDKVVALEKKYEEERKALAAKLKGGKEDLPDAVTCDKGNAMEWLTETETISAKIKDMMKQSTDLKPTLEAILKCKPVVDDALIEKVHEFPKKLTEMVEVRRGPYVVDRCLATASFYDEVSVSVKQGEEAEKNRRRMKEKEESDLRRASSVPTLRQQTESKKNPEPKGYANAK